jgi:hypothetical protein
MIDHKWQTEVLSKKQIYRKFIKFLILIVLLSSIFPILGEYRPNRMPQPFPVLGFLICIIIGITLFIIATRDLIKYAANTKKIVIPIMAPSKVTNEMDVAYDYYQEIVYKIKLGLEQIRYQFSTGEKGKLGKVPYGTGIYIKPNGITIRIIRIKNNLIIKVSNINLDNELFFEQTLKGIINDVIENIENPFAN